MRTLRRLAGGFVLLLVLGAAVYSGASFAGSREWLPERSPGAVRALAILFVGCDVLIVVLLIALLVAREPRLPRPLDGLIPLSGRWSWLAVLVLGVLAYLALAPLTLLVLSRMRAL